MNGLFKCAFEFELQVPGGLRLRVCGPRAEEGLSHHQPQPASGAGARALKVLGKCQAVWEGMEEGVGWPWTEEGLSHHQPQSATGAGVLRLPVWRGWECGGLWGDVEERAEWSWAPACPPYQTDTALKPTLHTFTLSPRCSQQIDIAGLFCLEYPQPHHHPKERDVTCSHFPLLPAASRHHSAVLLRTPPAPPPPKRKGLCP